jgi:hypothetical protein
MIVRRWHSAQQLNTDATWEWVGHLQTVIKRVGFSLLLLCVTCCTPKPSSLAKFATPQIVPISSPAITAAPTHTPTSTPANSVPVLAYYYIWFDAQSWNRAKADYPLLGRYSSDDPDVMRQHVRWAKEAKIDGFIVSWKSTQKLNRRLSQLVEIADQEDFKLAIIYESLTFERNPLPVVQVDADLAFFIDHYAGHQVFDLFGKPMVIWSGIWEFSTQDIESVVQDKREHIFILASEKNVKGYQRVSNMMDGDAYYWSSVNPETHPGYLEKLIAMGEAVHENGGIWIAPAAPGYDSRFLGGTTVIERKDGETLRTELNVASQSSPDAIGLISWNEFSENSHVEPSETHGHRYLDVLAEVLPFTLHTR